MLDGASFEAMPYSPTSVLSGCCPPTVWMEADLSIERPVYHVSGDILDPLEECSNE